MGDGVCVGQDHDNCKCVPLADVFGGLKKQWLIVLGRDREKDGFDECHWG